MSSLSAGMWLIAEVIGHRKGTFVLAKTEESDGLPDPFVLAVGSIRAVSVGKGFVITIGLAREQVQTLRAMCDEALAEGQSREQVLEDSEEALERLTKERDELVDAVIGGPVAGLIELAVRERDVELARLRPVYEAAKAWEDAQCDGKSATCLRTVDGHGVNCPTSTSLRALVSAIDAATAAISAAGEGRGK